MLERPRGDIFQSDTRAPLIKPVTDGCGLIKLLHKHSRGLIVEHRVRMCQAKVVSSLITLTHSSDDALVDAAATEAIAAALATMAGTMATTGDSP